MSDVHPSGVSRGAMVALAAALLAAVFTLSSCEEAFTGPSIVSMTITPSTIEETEQGMFDEFFEVEIVTSGFIGEIEGAEVFIQDPFDRQAPFDESMYPVVEGNTLVIENISKQWFANVPPGTYDIGATVRSADAEITQRDLAQVTVTEASNGTNDGS